MLRLRERQLANFVPWGPAELNLTLGRNPLIGERTSHVNGLLLANHTSVSSVRLAASRVSNLFFRPW